MSLPALPLAAFTLISRPIKKFQAWANHFYTGNH